MKKNKWMLMGAGAAMMLMAACGTSRQVQGTGKVDAGKQQLKAAPIIILDEATAFADAENEHQIQLAFEGLTSGKTVLMIAHRLSTIQDADMILVFGDGKIIERGNHDELLKQNGVYASMWKEYQTQIIWKVGTTVRKEENHD